MNKPPKRFTQEQCHQALNHHFDNNPANLKDYLSKNIGVYDIVIDVHQRMLNSSSTPRVLNEYGVNAFIYIVKKYHAPSGDNKKHRNKHDT